MKKKVVLRESINCGQYDKYVRLPVAVIEALGLEQFQYITFTINPKRPNRVIMRREVSEEGSGNDL